MTFTCAAKPTGTNSAPLRKAARRPVAYYKRAVQLDPEICRRLGGARSRAGAHVFLLRSNTAAPGRNKERRRSGLRTTTRPLATPTSRSGHIVIAAWPITPAPWRRLKRRGNTALIARSRSIIQPTVKTRQGKVGRGAGPPGRSGAARSAEHESALRARYDLAGRATLCGSASTGRARARDHA